MYADYIVNRMEYVFTNDTIEQQIGIQLLTDASGEGIESFVLSLVLRPQMISANIVFPSSVTVIIIDDDCKLQFAELINYNCIPLSPLHINFIHTCTP